MWHLSDMWRVNREILDASVDRRFNIVYILSSSSSESVIYLRNSFYASVTICATAQIYLRNANIVLVAQSTV